ncbi:hypothetical protein PIB30_104172, partial [Stylosanthes scabra]|nr:hypothetical protein [Stylosanthes scabra]
MIVNPQPSQPSSSTQLPSQPLPNPKGGINMVQTNKVEETEEEQKEEDVEEEDDEDWLYESLAKMAGEESFDSEEECEEADVAEVVEVVEVSSTDKEEEFFITT